MCSAVSCFRARSSNDELFWWPFLGSSFPHDALLPATWVVVVEELVGLVVCWFLVGQYDLYLRGPAAISCERVGCARQPERFAGARARTGMVVRTGCAGRACAPSASTTNRPSPGPSATGMPSASSSARSSSARTPDGGEVVAHDERVRTGEQAHRLELAEHTLAAAGEPDPRARHHEAEQRDRLERFSRREQRAVAERRARTRVEQVHRNLARFERRELEREVDALLQRLAHAEDAAAAQLHSRVDGEAGGADAVVVGVRRADAREHLATRLEVVVVAAHARGREPLRLRRREQAERARHFEPGLAVDRVDRVDDLGEEALLGPAHGDDDAELRGAGVARRVRRSEHLVEVEEGVDVDVGVEARRLRAERAVFGARAGLAVDQALELDLGPAVLEPHAVGEGDERRKLVEREGRDRQHLVAGERAALVEQGTLGAVEGIMHARQATRSRFGGSDVGARAIGEAPTCSPRPSPPWRGRALQQVGVLPPATACTAASGKCARPRPDVEAARSPSCTPSE